MKTKHQLLEEIIMILLQHGSNTSAAALAARIFEWHHQQQQPPMTEEQMEQEAREYANNFDYLKSNRIGFGQHDYVFTSYLDALKAHGQPPDPVEDGVLDQPWSVLDDDIRLILGRPNFACARIANRLREMGYECEPKAEMAQALVIHTMLGFYQKHGKTWMEELNAYLKKGEPITSKP